MSEPVFELHSRKQKKNNIEPKNRDMKKKVSNSLVERKKKSLESSQVVQQVFQWSRFWYRLRPQATHPLLAYPLETCSRRVFCHVGAGVGLYHV